MSALGLLDDVQVADWSQGMDSFLTNTPVVLMVTKKTRTPTTAIHLPHSCQSPRRATRFPVLPQYTWATMDVPVWSRTSWPHHERLPVACLSKTFFVTRYHLAHNSVKQRISAPPGTSTRCKLSVIAEATSSFDLSTPIETLLPYASNFHPRKSSAKHFVTVKIKPLQEQVFHIVYYSMM